MPTPLTDADKVLRNDTGKDIVTQLTSIASSIATPASLVGLSDTAITTPTDEQELTYNSSLSKWNNKTTRVELTQQQYDLLVANNEDLPDVDYYITDAGGAEVVSSAPNISDVYNPNTTYNTGDLCIYNNVLYKCKTNNVTGAWDGTKWDRTTVDELLAEKANSSNLATVATSGDFYDLTPKPIRKYIVNSSSPVTLQGQITAGYATFIIIGFAEGLGGVALAIEMAGGNLSKVINLLNGQNFSSTHLSFSGSNSQLTISTDLQATVMIFG